MEENSKMEILNQIDVYDTPSWVKDWTEIFLVGFIIGAGLFFLSFAFKHFIPCIIGGILAIVCVFSAFGISLFVAFHQIDTGRNQYEVKFTEDISFKEMYEKYEVIEKRGEIWVIEDKEEIK